MLLHELITNLGDLHTLKSAVQANPIFINNPGIFALDTIVKLDKFTTMFGIGADRLECVELLRVVWNPLVCGNPNIQMVVFQLPDRSIVSGFDLPYGQFWNKSSLNADSTYTVEPLNQFQLKSLVKNHLYTNWPQDFYAEPFKHAKKLVYTWETTDFSGGESWMNKYLNSNPPVSELHMAEFSQTFNLLNSGKLRAHQPVLKTFREQLKQLYPRH